MSMSDERSWARGSQVHEAPDFVVLPRTTVKTSGLQPEDLGVLAWLLTLSASSSIASIEAAMRDGGWEIGGRLPAIVSRLMEAGLVEETSEYGADGLARTTLLARTRPKEDRQASLPLPRTTRPAVATGWVYAIREARGGRVKIGRSESPKGRLKTLRTGSPDPLHLVWTTEGGTPLEQFLHSYFADRHVHGEWFDFARVATDDLALMLQEAATAFGGGQ